MIPLQAATFCIIASIYRDGGDKNKNQPADYVALPKLCVEAQVKTQNNDQPMCGAA